MIIRCIYTCREAIVIMIVNFIIHLVYPLVLIRITIKNVRKKILM